MERANLHSIIETGEIDIDEAKSLDEITIEKETYCVVIPICVMPSQLARWKNISERLRKVNKKNKITNYGRISLIKTMDTLERLLNEKEKASKESGQ